MADDDMREALQRIDDLEASNKFVRQVISDNYKEFMASRKDLEVEIADLRKAGGPSKDMEREIADLKARVKDMEGKLAKMGKK